MGEGLRIVGEARGALRGWPDVLREYGAIIPPYPDAKVITPVRTPPMPKLSVHATPEQNARMVALSFRGVVHRFYRITLHSFRFGMDLRTMPTGVTLFQAAAALLQRDIAPAAWCAFSCDAWRDQGHHKPPTTIWTLSKVRIEERLEWFHTQRQRWEGGKLYVSTAHHQLLSMHVAMQHDLLRVPELTRAVVRAVVRRHFPYGVWGELVQQAETAANDAAEMFKAAVPRGDFVW